MQSTVILFRGEPGTGKTTLANTVIESCLVENAERVAADDYPGIYDDQGQYVLANQKVAHAWCFDQYIEFLKSDINLVCVDNTFVELWQMDKYIAAALKYGYNVQIVRCEAVILASGKDAKNVHNVPLTVVENMRDRYQPFKPSAEGLTINDTAQILSELKQPSTIWADMDGTIKTTKSGKTFTDDPTDMILNPDFVEGFKLLISQNLNLPLAILSNQRGLQKANKTEDFLRAEVVYLFSLLHQEGIYPALALFAPAQESKQIIYYNPKKSWSRLATNIFTDKPNIGMGTQLLDVTSAVEKRCIWYIGDAHIKGRLEDYQFVENLKSDYPFIHYVPINLLPIAARLL